MTATYGAEYYENYFGGGGPYERSPRWLQSFDDFARNIVERLAPATALDAGCAMGMLVEKLRDRGVDAHGFDISGYALALAREDIRQYLWEASLSDPLPRVYDLIVCIEVLEHLSRLDGEAAVENLCGHTDRVLLSTTPEHYEEPTHLNVQPPEYWAELFARHDFVRDVDVDASFISPWAVLFRRRQKPLAGVVRDYERFSSRLDRENKALREGLVQAQAGIAASRDESRAAKAEADQARRSRDESVGQLEQQLTYMRGLLSWRLAERGRLAALRVLPFDSRRGRLVRGALRRISG
jgi:SAM-dependent methyltransferase